MKEIDRAHKNYEIIAYIKQYSQLKALGLSNRSNDEIEFQIGNKLIGKSEEYHDEYWIMNIYYYAEDLKE